MERDWLDLYLEEDLGRGDISSAGLGELPGNAWMVMRAEATIAGLVHAAQLFERRGAEVELLASDGDTVAAGTSVMRVGGPARGILEAERTALNLVGRMSGIASETRRLMAVLAKECCSAVVAGTRKTTPGFRAFEKEAIRIGGGDPHRMGLWDEAMIKDNHRAAYGGVSAAVEAVRKSAPDAVVTVEVESLEEALEAAEVGAQWIMIDNQAPEVGKAWAEAVWKDHPQTRIEASGGITPERIAQYGWADRISLGWLTHQARSVDVGLDWEGA